MQSSAKKAGYNAGTGCVELSARKTTSCKMLSKMGAKTQAAVFAVLQTAHSLLKTGRTATQREVYYLHKALFANAAECNQTILRVCALLSLPRHRLGIVASSRGYFAGCIEIHVRARIAMFLEPSDPHREIRHINLNSGEIFRTV